MQRRTRKPPVKPEVRRKWLDRYEKDGETPSQIAAKDGFDIRTVRKQIELARQEIELRETRLLVLRNAIEEHYRDLCRFAEELDRSISEEASITFKKSERMWNALRQHLPRSPLWRYFDKWEHVWVNIAECDNEIRARLKEELEAEPRLNKVLSDYADATIGLTEALAYQSKSWARGWQGLSIQDNFKVGTSAEGLVKVQFGFINMEKVPEKHTESLRKILEDYSAKISTWNEYMKLQRLFIEMERVKVNLQDELATIILKRIVSGRCRYCPV